VLKCAHLDTSRHTTTPLLSPVNVKQKVVISHNQPQKGLSPGSGGDEACAFLGFNIIKVPKAVIAAYLPIFCRASFLLILSLLFLFILVLG